MAHCEGPLNGIGKLRSIAQMARHVRMGILPAAIRGQAGQNAQHVAHTNKGPGNGKVATDIQVDVTQLAGPWSLFLSGSYGFRHHDNGNRDTQSVALGVGRILTARLSAGAIYTWRRSSRRDGEDGHDIAVYAAYDLSERLSLTAYGATGFSQASADTALGLQFTLRWQ